MSSNCPHVCIVGDYSQEDIARKQQSRCENCSASGPNLWACLHRDCLSVGCGDGQADHSAKHFSEKPTHSLTLNLLSLRVWCYKCEKEVFLENNDPPAPGIASQAVHIFSNKVGIAEPDVNGDDDDDDEANTYKPRGAALGLTGLQNLGNTCYMNAAIQALSNCPQLTQFFLDCGSFVRCDVKPGLSKSYMTLVREMWHKNRPSYVVPSGVSHGIKMVFPVFRGFNQQDAQEFLRCFMDQLHEELKETKVKPNHNSDNCQSTISHRNTDVTMTERDYDGSMRVDPSMGIPNEDSSQSEAEFETCDSGLSSEKSSYSGELIDQEPMEENDVTPAVVQENDSLQASSPTSSMMQRFVESSDEGLKSNNGATHGSNVSLESPMEGLLQEATPLLPSQNQMHGSHRVCTSNRFTHSLGVSLVGNRPNVSNLKANRQPKETNIIIKKIPPQFRSIISDIFDGKILSSVQCLTCDTVSTTKETFQDLSLPIPTRDHLHLLHSASHGQGQLQKGPGVNVGNANCQEANRQGWLQWMFGWMFNWFWGPTISLQDCLSAFFSADELKGDNMYSCDKCKKLRNGIKYSKVLMLPEVLCIHLKRFRHEVMFSSKIGSYVTFPLEGLDMSMFLHKDCPRTVTMYDLIAVICHHGTAGSGHYTAYALNHLSEQWYEFDDQYVTAVDPAVVQNCEAYVLFYRKSCDEIIKKRQLAVELMERSKTEPGLLQFFISKQWVNRFNTFAEPGPITNTDFLCSHGGVHPTKAAYVDELCIRLSQAVWEYLHDTFGGGPPCNHLFICPTCQGEQDNLERRRKMEHDTFVILNKEYQGQDSPHAVYALNLHWFKQWETFVKGKSNEPPGPVDNMPITYFKNGQPTLRSGSDYGSLSDLMWRFLYDIYGGGPEIILQQNVSMSNSCPPNHVHASSRHSSMSGPVEPAVHPIEAQRKGGSVSSRDSSSLNATQFQSGMKPTEIGDDIS